MAKTPTLRSAPLPSPAGMYGRRGADVKRSDIETLKAELGSFGIQVDRDGRAKPVLCPEGKKRFPTIIKGIAGVDKNSKL